MQPPLLITGGREVDAFLMSNPYISAKKGFSLYFDSRNRPTPNRTNWSDPRTDAALQTAKTALDATMRVAAIAEAPRIVAESNVWLPIARENLWLAAEQRVEGAQAHGIYGVGLFKGLDIQLTR